MQIWRSFEEISVPSNGTSVAIGVFDGVHRGHRALLDAAVAAAEAGGLEPVMVTFDPHPVELFRPEARPARLTDVDRRAELAAAEGVAATFVLPFDREIAALEPAEFVDRVLVGALRARHVTVGGNFTFGRGAAGDPAVLTTLCAERGIGVTVCALVGDEADAGDDGEAVSSTRIRAAIAAGDVAAAAELLGRPYRVGGEVVHGAGRGGRELGYPTANLDVDTAAAVPADGVYAGWFTVRPDAGHPAGSRMGSFEVGARYPTAVSVGTNPTFGEHPRSIEAFVLDEDGDLYGCQATIDLVARVRGMERFSSVDELLVAMAGDVRRTREILGLPAESPAR